MSKRNTISHVGKELEGILNNSNLDSFTKNLVEKAMEIGRTLGSLEQQYEDKNDPYSSYKCVERYENLKKLLNKN